MKFRTKSVGQKTENLAGGEAFKESPELELVSLVLTSFVNDKFYEKVQDQLDRLQNLISRVKPEFAAKTAIYARTNFGMRSITHALMGELLGIVKGQEWLKRAIAKVVYRPDDALEIASYYLSQFKDNSYKKGLPGAFRKGANLALQKFNDYELAKYRGERSSLKMVDLFNLVHPKPGKEQEALYKQLVAGELKSKDTWENKLVEAGQSVQDIEDETEQAEKLKEAKAQAWGELIREKKLGYFALLRNLRNIHEQAPEVLDAALDMLVDPKLIKKSLVLPFRFSTALRELEEENVDRKVIIALHTALDTSLNNVPKLDGKTLVVLDVSGSMAGRPQEIGSIFAAVLYKVNDATLMTFSDEADFRQLNPNDSALTIAKQLQEVDGGGTDFHSIFRTLDKAKFDRIIILSDMQGWVDYDAPMKDFEEYKRKSGANPFVYSFDLNGYGSLQFPENRVFALAGFSDKILEVMKLLETDRQALISEIEKVEI